MPDTANPTPTHLDALLTALRRAAAMDVAERSGPAAAAPPVGSATIHLGGDRKAPDHVVSIRGEPGPRRDLRLA